MEPNSARLEQRPAVVIALLLVLVGVGVVIALWMTGDAEVEAGAVDVSAAPSGQEDVATESQPPPQLAFVEHPDDPPPPPDRPAGTTVVPATAADVAEAAAPTTSSVAPTSTTAPSTTTPAAVTSQTPGTDVTTAPNSNVASSAGLTEVPSSTAAPTTTTVVDTTTVPDTTQAPATATADGPLAGGQLFADPYNSAAQWAKNNPSDSRAQVIADRIGSKAIAKWFGGWNGDVQADVADYVSRARAANAVPALVAYNVPDRDCGQHSAGGAANFGEYEQWIAAFTDGLGNGPAIIVLEPDALALNDCAGSDRNDAISDAVVTIKTECSQCRVYLDAGHSSWVSPKDMASRLIDAGVLDADGFFTNVSNYNATGDEAAFGAQVLAELGNPSGLGQVIDVSRNGNGSNGEWCDPAGRAVGADPVLNPSQGVHAHLWVKVPGEADGCIGSAGQFVPDRAFELATS